MFAANVSGGLSSVLTASNAYLIAVDDDTSATLGIAKYDTDDNRIANHTTTWADAPDNTDVFRLFPPAGSGAVLDLTAANTGAS